MNIQEFHFRFSRKVKENLFICSLNIIMIMMFLNVTIINFIQREIFNFQFFYSKSFLLNWKQKKLINDVWSSLFSLFFTYIFYEHLKCDIIIWQLTSITFSIVYNNDKFSILNWFQIETGNLTKQAVCIFICQIC